MEDNTHTTNTDVTYLLAGAASPSFLTNRPQDATCRTTVVPVYAANGDAVVTTNGRVSLRMDDSATINISALGMPNLHTNPFCVS